MSKTKLCFKCGSRRPLESFYRHPRMADGRLGKCKACTRSDVQKNRKERAEQYRDYDRERNGDPDRVAATTERVQAWREKFPGKARAQNAVNNALRDGRLTKPSRCSGCKRRRKLHAHHADYRKKLDVAWLCHECHSAEHRG